MFKKIVLIFLGTLQSYGVSYALSIDVSDFKKNGQKWDIFGGAPDIFLRINREFLPLYDICKDQYNCKFYFSSNVTKWEIEVYDKDLLVHDLIGRGHCSFGKPCSFSQIKISIQR